MPLGQKLPQDWHAILMLVLRLVTRIPLIGFLIFLAGCFSFLSVMFVYRLTHFLYVSYLDGPWA